MILDQHATSLVVRELARSLARCFGPKRGPFDHLAYHGARRDGLPISFVSWIEIWAIRPSGDMFGIEVECGTLTERPLGRVDEIIAIQSGASTYPWLATLLPARPNGAVDCPSCRGRGFGPKFFCSCGNLGWIPPRPVDAIDCSACAGSENGVSTSGCPACGGAGWIVARDPDARAGWDRHMAVWMSPRV